MQIQLVVIGAFSAILIASGHNLNTNSVIQPNNVSLIEDEQYIKTSQINYDDQLYEEFKTGNQQNNSTVVDKHCVNVNTRLSGGKTLLHLAVIKGDIQTVHNLIGQYKVPVDARDTWDREPLYYAVQNGRVEIARILLQNHASPDSKDADNKPVLHLVVDLDENVSLIMAQLLIQNKANVDISDKFGNTLLHTAAMKSSLSIIEFLLEKGAYVNAKNINNDTPLGLAKLLQPNRSDIASFLMQKSAQDWGDMVDFHHACGLGNLDFIKYLHEVRAVDVQIKDSDRNRNRNGLFYAIEGKGTLDVVKYLVNIGVSIREMTTDKYTLVNYAVLYNKFDIAKYLIEQGADFKSANTDNNTPLHFAALHNNLEMVKYLLHSGLNANINDKGFYNQTPLIYTFVFLFVDHSLGNLKLVQYLIKSGAQTNTTDLSGKTALTWATENSLIEIKQYLEQLPHDTKLQTQIDTNSLFFAAAQNNIKLVEQYLNKNISVNVKDEDDCQTPLYRAIYYNGQLDMVKFLHSKGADVKQFNATELENLVYLSIIKHKFDIAKYLMDNGADYKTHGVSGNTPLHGAIEIGYNEWIKLLLDKEVYDSHKNSNGNSPLELLVQTRNENMLEYLIFEYKNSEGKSILHQIASQGLNSQIAFFLERGALVNAQDKLKNTPLHLAALNGHLEAVKLLSQQICVNLAAKNANNQTAYDIAQINKKYSVAQYLCELMKKNADVSQVIGEPAKNSATKSTFLFSNIFNNFVGTFKFH